MSQVSTVLVEDYREKSGTTNGKPWTNHSIRDANGDWYGTFEAGVVKPEMKGQRVEIEWEPDGNFKNLLRATPVEETAETPPLGTGQYVKGKEAPETQRNIRASVALENAVAWCSASEDARAALNEHGVVKIAQVFYNALEAMAEGNGGTQTSSPSSEVPL